MHKKRIALLTILFVLFGCLVTWADEDVTIDVHYGYDDTAKLGRYLPVYTTIHSKKPQDISAKVQFIVQEDDGIIYRYEHSIDLKAQDQISREDTIPLGYKTKNIEVCVIADDKKELAKKDIELGQGEKNNRLNIGILSDTPEKLSYFNHATVDYGILTTKTVQLEKDSFPINAKGLDQLDVIIISNYRIRDLGTEQSMALMNWVKAGGVMILGTGARANDTLGRFAPELLDEMFEEPKMRKIHLDTGMEESEDRQKRDPVEMSSVAVQLHGGNILVSDANFPLLATVNKEKGVIAVSAYDFVDAQNFANQNRFFANQLLLMIMGKTRIEGIANGLYGSNAENATEVQNMINNGNVSILPSIPLFVLVLFGYIVVIGPVLYFVFRQGGWMGYYRISVVGVSVLFAILVFILGVPTRLENVFYSYATILDTTQDSISQRIFLNLRNPYNERYNVSFDRDYDIYPISQEKNVGNDFMHSSIKFLNSADTKNVEMNYIGSFQPSLFRLEKSMENQAGIGLFGEINLFKNQVSGEITNYYPYKVTNGVLIFYGKVAILGDFEAGETKKLDGLDLYTIPIDENYATATRLTGMDQYNSAEIENQQYMLTFSRRNLLKFYMENYMSGYSADARVLAFSQEPLENEILVNDHYDHSGISLLSSSISVTHEDDTQSKEYRSALMTSAKVISGSYDARTNTATLTEPLVLEYLLGNDMDISELLIEPMSKEFYGKNSAFPQKKWFQGEMDFYNYKTREFVPIDLNKIDYTRDELENYLLEGNRIRIRYVGTGEEKENIILPMISIVGGKD